MNQIEASAVTIDTNEGISRAWRNHILALGAVLILILVEFHQAVSAAFRVWVVSPTYSHCFLIIPIVGWLVWEKRDLLRAMKPTVEPRALLFILPLLVLWWLGQLLAVNEIAQYAVIGLMQTTIIGLLGTKVVRRIWFPVFFLLFLVPTGEYLIGPMQQFATRFTDAGLSLFGIPHYTEGTDIELTNGVFQIAEACAGLRFLIATVTLGVLFAYLMYQRIHKIVLFLFASVIIPLIGNGLRCLFIIMLAHFTSNEYGAGADHIIYGWGFNVAILLVVIILGSRFRDEPRKPSIVPIATPSRQDGALSTVAVAAMSAILISVGPAWASWRGQGGQTVDGSAIQNALQSEGWHADAPGDNWRPQFASADLRFQQERGSEEPVNLFVAYYARPQPGRTVIAHENKPWDDTIWNPSGGGKVNANLGGRRVVLNEFTLSSNSGQRLVWFTYWADGTITNSSLFVRLLEAKGALNGRGGQAVIAVSTQLDNSVDEVRARLRTALSSLGSIPSALHRAEIE
jgi:exosortase A